MVKNTVSCENFTRLEYNSSLQCVENFVKPERDKNIRKTIATSD
jgi:hypothetical protein